MNTFSDYLDPDSDLAHYGIKGMKWGVRKDPQSSSVTPDAGGGGGSLDDLLEKDAEGNPIVDVAYDKGETIDDFERSVDNLDKIFSAKERAAIKDAKHQMIKSGGKYLASKINDVVRDAGETVASKLFGKKINKNESTRRNREVESRKSSFNNSAKKWQALDARGTRKRVYRQKRTTSDGLAYTLSSERGRYTGK